MVNPERNILFIAGTSIWHPNNHRSQHLATHLKRWRYPLDVIGQINFYTGPPASAWTRFLHGFRNLCHERARVARVGDDLHIAVRSLPGQLFKHVQDLWVYLAVRRLLKKRYELCIFGSPTNSLLVLLLKRKGVVKTVIYDDWDYFPGDVTAVKGRLDKFLMERREDICMRNADFVTSVSQPLADLRKRQGAKQVLAVPNGVDYAQFQTAQKKKSHPPTLIYIGHLYSPWGVDLPIRALPALRARIPDIRYVVVGEGPDENVLRSLAYQEMKLQDCVLFLGGQESYKMPQFLAEADIGVLTCRKELFREYASPLKACEYMAAGLPVVGTRVGEMVKAIEASQAGIIIDFTPDAFAEAVTGLFADRKKLEGYSANAIKCAMKYDWDKVLAPLHELIDSLLTWQSAETAYPMSRRIL